MSQPYNATAARLSLKRIQDCYQAHDYARDNIEYCLEALPSRAVVCSVKGTSRNEGQLFGLTRDIISDIRCVPRHSDLLDAWHPGGFLDAGKDLAYGLAAGREPIRRDIPLYLEGHSLGGAAVLIAGAILAKLGYRIHRITTFGAPHTGRLPDLEGIEVLCFENGWDIVTTMPPFWRAAAKPIKIGRGKRSPLDDHRLDSYEQSLVVGAVERDLMAWEGNV